MEYATDRPFADPQKAARKLMDIASDALPYQDTVRGEASYWREMLQSESPSLTRCSMMLSLAALDAAGRFWLCPSRGSASDPGAPAAVALAPRNSPGR